MTRIRRLIPLFMLLTACVRARDLATVRAALADADRAFNRATAARRADGWMEFMAEDGALIRPSGTIQGRAAVREAIVKTFADTSFSLTVSSPFPGNTTYTATLFPSPNQIQDVFGNDLPNPSSVTFATGAPDFTPPTLIDARIVNNVGNTDFGDVGDAFTVTFSERMNGSTTGGIALQDQDGSTATVLCGANSSCIWNTATDTVTVTVTTPMPSGGGTTPGQQIPMNVVFLFGFTDEAGNAPNVLGSSDRLIDYE